MPRLRVTPFADDPLSVQVRRLRDQPDIVVLEGFHALKHAVRFQARIELALATDLAGADALAAELAPDVRSALRDLLRAADREVLALAVRRVPHTGVVGFARRPADGAERLRHARLDRPIVLLEDPHHLGNVGAVIRVAAAADAAAVITTGGRDPWDAQAIRGSAGLHFALPVLRADAAVIKDRPLVAVDPEGEVIGAHRIPPGAILAFGTERHGLTPQTLGGAAMRVRIPMRAGISSLNLATAVAVALYGLH